MEIDKIVEFAPYIVFVLLFFWQNKVFVRPCDLEKKHREILKEAKENFVELNAYKEFQHRVYSELEKVSDGINELKEFLIKT